MMYFHQPVHIIDGIHISGVYALHNAELLRVKCITRLLKLFISVELTELYKPPMPYLVEAPSLTELYNAIRDEFEICDIGVGLDGPVPSEFFERGVKFIRSQIRAGNHVLIMSRGGTCRAPILAIAYMLEAHNYSAPDAFREVIQIRHRLGISLNKAPWQSLFDHYHLPYTVEDVRRWGSEHE